MSRLIRLYPAAWRARYEAEFLDLLEKRPMSPTGWIDLLRGAFDAHVHPQVKGSHSQPWTHRIPGLLAISAGLIWASDVLYLAFWANPEDDWGSLIGISLVLMFGSLPGDYMANHGRRIAIGIGVAVAALFLGRVLPWSVGDGLLNVAAGGAAYLVITGGMLTLAAIRAGIGATARWVILAAAVLVPVALSVPLILGLAAFGPNFTPVFALLAPYGIAWAFAGLKMTIMGAQTLVDLPPLANDPQTQAG